MQEMENSIIHKLWGLAEEKERGEFIEEGKVTMAFMTNNYVSSVCVYIY